MASMKRLFASDTMHERAVGEAWMSWRAARIGTGIGMAATEARMSEGGIDGGRAAKAAFMDAVQEPVEARRVAWMSGAS